MSRIVYDSSRYYTAKAKLPKPDGIHCIICGKSFDKIDKRKSYCSQECFSKWYYSIGINSWSELRERVLKRDGKCIKCGLQIGANIHTTFEVHHIKPISESGDEFDPENCMVLCYECHKEMHTVIGKKKRNNWSLEDFVVIY